MISLYFLDLSQDHIGAPVSVELQPRACRYSTGYRVVFCGLLCSGRRCFVHVSFEQATLSYFAHLMFHSVSHFLTSYKFRGWMDGWPGGCVEGWIDGWVGVWIGGCMDARDGWMGGLVDGCMNGCMHGSMGFVFQWGGWMDG